MSNVVDLATYRFLKANGDARIARRRNAQPSIATLQAIAKNLRAKGGA
jgi:hypothetical protein